MVGLGFIIPITTISVVACSTTRSSQKESTQLLLKEQERQAKQKQSKFDEIKNNPYNEQYHQNDNKENKDNNNYSYFDENVVIKNDDSQIVENRFKINLEDAMQKTTYNNEEVVAYNTNKMFEYRKKLFEKGYFNFDKSWYESAKKYTNLINNNFNKTIYEVVNDKKNFVYNKNHFNIQGVGNGSVISLLIDKQNHPWLVLLSAKHVLDHKSFNTNDKIQLRFDYHDPQSPNISNVVYGKLHKINSGDIISKKLKTHDIDIALFEVRGDFNLATQNINDTTRWLKNHFEDINHKWAKVNNLTYLSKIKNKIYKNYIYSYTNFTFKEDDSLHHSFYDYINVNFKDDSNVFTPITIDNEEEYSKFKYHNVRLTLTKTQPGNSGTPMYFVDKDDSVVIDGLIRSKNVSFNHNIHHFDSLTTKYNDSIDFTMVEYDFRPLSQHINYIQDTFMKKNTNVNYVDFSVDDETLEAFGLLEKEEYNI